MEPGDGDVWSHATTAAALESAGKMVVDLAGTRVLLLWNTGSPVAMDDVCIHRGRSLFDGVLLNQRLICAGHQWAFDLATGYCRARERYQPVYEVRIADGAVLVARPEPADVDERNGGSRTESLR
jgi:nitrite reductase/ring-hydroxylating ferredoxin subunit